MTRKITSVFMLIALVAMGSVARAADAKPPQAPKQAEQNAKLVSEGDFAKWLVNVLGLARSLPALPSKEQCFAALMQNSISPKAGWNSTNLVTMGTLARVVTQALHKQAEVTNPQDDNSWIQYLKSIGIEFGTIGQAMANLGPIDPLLSADATLASSDPLRKLAHIRPLGEQQFGADLQSLPPVIFSAQPVTQPVIQQVFQQAPVIPHRPRPVTPT